MCRCCILVRLLIPSQIFLLEQPASSVIAWLSRWQQFLDSLASQAAGDAAASGEAASQAAGEASKGAAGGSERVAPNLLNLQAELDALAEIVELAAVAELACLC